MVSRILALPEFAWMAEKTTALARANCSTKEHIPHLLHAWRKALSAERIQALCSTAPPGLASQGRESMPIDVHPNKFRKSQNLGATRRMAPNTRRKEFLCHMASMSPSYAVIGSLGRPNAQGARQEG